MLMILAPRPNRLVTGQNLVVALGENLPSDQIHGEQSVPLEVCLHEPNALEI
jgi:hypothetical protein